jgi:hypothetical protein
MMTLRLAVTLCLLITPQFGLGQNELSFDKLSDCSSLAKMRTRLDHPLSDDCRRPSGRLETKIMSQLSESQGVSACLMSSPPVPLLSGFSCVDLSFEGAREITCFRSVKHRLLERYFEEYDSLYRARVLKYLDAAGQCAVGNGDATAAPKSLFPPPLKVLAKVNFGFALGIGNERTSSAYHGFADVDPDLETALGAIEVFDILKVKQGITGELAPASGIGKLQVQKVSQIIMTRQSQAGGGKATTTEGRLKVEIDDLSDARDKMSEALGRQFNVPVDAKIRLFEFKYSGPKEVGLAKRKSDLDAWQKGVGSILSDARFRTLTRADLAGSRFRDPDELGSWMIRNLPFGQRDQAKQMFSPHVIFRVNDRLESCIRIGEVMLREPEEGVRIDYGGIALLMLDEGRNCDDAEVSSDDVIDKATAYVKEEVNGQ